MSNPLKVEVVGGELRIIIGIDTLAHAVSYAEWANPYDEIKLDYVRTFAIVDAKLFADDVRLAMLREREDGSSLLSDFLDKASNDAVDDGSCAQVEQELRDLRATAEARALPPT
jgi:hypothetical protein